MDNGLVVCAQVVSRSSIKNSPGNILWKADVCVGYCHIINGHHVSSSWVPLFKKCVHFVL